MIVNENHLVTDIFHGAGTFELSADRAGSRYALVAVRTLVDADDPEDIGAACALQDQFVLDCASAEPYRSPDWDTGSMDETREGLLLLAKGLTHFDQMFVADDATDMPNAIPTPDGWNVLIRLYQPGREVTDGSWKPPEITPSAR